MVRGLGLSPGQLEDAAALHGCYAAWTKRIHEERQQLCAALSQVRMRVRVFVFMCVCVRAGGVKVHSDAVALMCIGVGAYVANMPTCDRYAASLPAPRPFLPSQVMSMNRYGNAYAEEWGQVRRQRAQRGAVCVHAAGGD